MAVVRLDKVSKQYGPHVVLDGVSLGIQPGERVGVVGVNGAGKTTLFRLMHGSEQPDLGRVHVARSVAIGYLTQEADVADDRTLIDEVGSALEDVYALERKLHAVSDQMSACRDEARLQELMASYERVNARFIAAGGHAFETRLHEILHGVGFGEGDYQLPVSALSGGQKSRAALAKLLLKEHTLLLLDEPTNHLDIDAVRWLEKFLGQYAGAAAIISHDRYLLDRVCQRIIEVCDRKVASYPGNYSNYAHVKHLRELTRQRQCEKDRAFIEKEQAFIRKHIAGQRTAEAKGRRKRLERQLSTGTFVTESARRQRRTRFQLRGADGGDGRVLRVDDLAMRYGDKELFSSLRLQVRAGERLGITGPNGTGKTTLLKIIMGEVAPAAGDVSFETAPGIGYYAQEPTALDPAASVIETVRTVRPDLRDQDLRTILGAFLFTGDDVFKPLGALSGGEQSRVRLAMLILSDPELLVLDEPTNHLDIPSREALEEALLDYGGTMIVVSHDRYFLDRIATRLLVMRPGACVQVAGNYSTYVEQSEQTAAPSAGKSAAKAPKHTERQAVAQRKTNRGQRSTGAYDRLAVGDIEAMIIERESQLEQLNERFGDPRVLKNPMALADLQEQVVALREELADLNEAWDERADAQ